jgi:hypothetical protein
VAPRLELTIVIPKVLPTVSMAKKSTKPLEGGSLQGFIQAFVWLLFGGWMVLALGPHAGEIFWAVCGLLATLLRIGLVGGGFLCWFFFLFCLFYALSELRQAAGCWLSGSYVSFTECK